MLIIILFHLSSHSVSAHSYFHRQTKSNIKLADCETLQQEWLTFQPKTKRYDINIFKSTDSIENKKNINSYLAYFNCNIEILLSTPSFNSYQNKILINDFKNPPQGLLGVYFKPRINPFKKGYPDESYKYTLEDLLEYEIAIEEAFVFWDVNQKPQEENVNKELIIINMFADQNQEEAINQYLIENNIIKKPKIIKLGCYNATTNTGLVLPLPTETLNSLKIEAIYFDDGIRIIDSNKHNLNDLLKLSNGAKNIYLFAFNIQKRKVVIELHDSLDPYQAIRNWKRENNLYTSLTLIKEGEYDKEIKEVEIGFEVSAPIGSKKFNIPFKVKIVSHLFETDNNIYLLLCNDSSFKIKLAKQYQTNYINWLNQCYIKYGFYYSGDEVRAKFGRSSRIIYDENGNQHYYKYITGFIFDDWYIDGNECSKRYYQFLDTTSPPTKPQELD
ncbi:hypothetical protein CWO85_00895 [Candidatus Phytoplasma ziziphi]|uniref:Uncharacterized protein n=2 Tax=Acholeplasmataceae TaxID=2146 RepID=A0A660HM42_ZIZJU|nr:hypothetical protein CWO85_00895 [Candidatus Phytoplasma ziziphi]